MDTGNNMAPSWSSVVENNKLEQFSNDDDEFSPEELSEKDETELELERLVFGDDVTFKNELKSWDLPATDGEAQNGEDDAALAALQDSEVCTNGFAEVHGITFTDKFSSFSFLTLRLIRTLATKLVAMYGGPIKMAPPRGKTATMTV